MLMLFGISLMLKFNADTQFEGLRIWKNEIVKALNVANTISADFGIIA